MKLKQLRRTHPDYDAETLRLYDDLCAGGQQFRKRVGEYLVQNDQEPAAAYKRRCKTAHYVNYIASIVNYFASALFTCPPVFTSDPADPDPWYATFKQNCDGRGTSLDVFLRGRFVEALVQRQSYWRIVAPDPGETVFANRAEWRMAGMDRVTLQAVPTTSIVHWLRADDGSFVWVMEYACRTDLLDPTDDVATVTETWTVWYADGTARRWELESKVGDTIPADKDVPEIDPPHNPLPVCPVVELALPAELWLLNHLADGQLEHFRQRNALAWSIRRTCYAMPWFYLKDARKPPKMGAGYYGILGLDEKIDWPAPPGAPFAAHAEYVAALKDEIHRVAQQLALGVDNNAAAVGRSGESKKADQAGTEVVLKAYGRITREPTERTMDLVAEARS